MKTSRNILLSILITLTFLPLLSQAADHPWDKKLPFKSGIIHYTLNGMEKGTETLYIRNNGTTTALYHNGKTSMMGMTMEMKTIEFTDPDWVYEYDLVEMTGSKSTNPMKYMIEEFNSLSAADKKKAMANAKAMGAAYPGMGMAEQNVEKFLGYSCDRVSAMGSTSLLIHDTDVPLKTEVDTMGMKMTVTAVKVEKGRVADKYFTHPTNIEAIHDQMSSDMARNMARQAVAMLVEGKIPESNQMMADPRMQHIPAEDQEDMQKAMEMMKGMFGNQQQ